MKLTRVFNRRETWMHEGMWLDLPLMSISFATKERSAMGYNQTMRDPLSILSHECDESSRKYVCSSHMSCHLMSMRAIIQGLSNQGHNQVSV